ncbi:MAG: hypothetical protein ACHQ1H_10770 [Nitrososphaerales archaeon]
METNADLEIRIPKNHGSDEDPMTTIITENDPESKKEITESAEKIRKSDSNVQVIDPAPSVDTKINGFKFSMEKNSDGTTVDISFRTKIRSKTPGKVEKAI